jgi:hypothetical protein
MKNPENYMATFTKGQRLFFVGSREKDFKYHLCNCEVIEVNKSTVVVRLIDKYGKLEDGKKITKVNIHKIFIDRLEAIEAARKECHKVLKIFNSIVKREEDELKRLDDLEKQKILI